MNKILPTFRMLHGIVFLMMLIVSYETHSAATQILNDVFFQNPAELSSIQKIRAIGGNLLLSPQFKFNGTTLEGQGSAKSAVVDSLPYLLIGYRLSDRVVAGINVTPSGYGHLDWPVDSIVADNSTVTSVLYYRAGFQLSYQLKDKLAIGAGFNLEYNKLAELDFIVTGLGNQINKVHGLNYTGDVGLFYTIDTNNYLTAAIYTPVNNAPGKGTSTLNTTVVNNLSLNFTEAMVVYVGLQHTINDKWQMEGKVYWSDWTVQKNIYFTNTTTGSYAVPTDWKPTWSFQWSTRYVLNERYAFLGGLLYETNPSKLSTNAIGYPLAPSGSVSLGLDLFLFKHISAQVLYGYGTFLPNSKINSSSQGGGEIAADLHAVVAQLTYKI